MKNWTLTFLLLCCGLLLLTAQEGPVLRLVGGEVRFPADFRASASLAEQLPLAPEGAARSWAWLQFSRNLSSSELDALRNAGIRLHGYLADYTYYASIPATVSGNPLRGLPVHSIQALQAGHVLSLPLQAFLQETDAAPRKLDVTARLHEGLEPQLALQILARAGFQPLEVHAGEGLIRLLLPPSRLKRLAGLPLFVYLEHTPEAGEPEDRNGRAMHRANLIQGAGANAPLAFDGSGVSILVRDDGKVGPHIDFQGRLDQRYCERPEDFGTHGDMVAGIALGGGNLRPTVQGMAIGAKLYTEDYNGNFNDFTLNLIQQEKITITNSSYSDGCNTGYTNRAVRVDRQLWEDPLLMHVFSAGNAGTTDCDYGAGPFWGNITGGHKVGKNALATANLYSNFALETSSSRGPVHDGRLKPDISAHGQGQLSTYPNHTINTGGGTSAAAPGIAGVLAQLTHAYRSLYPGEEAPAALLKAALLNTASDMGAPGPDFRYGWGHVNAYQAYKLLEEQRFQLVTLEPATNDQITIEVPAGLAEARFMLYWADPPALNQASKALVQDFELRVTAPGQMEARLPLVLDHTPDPTRLALAAQPGEDHLNNVEQVFFAQPESGSYTVSIQGLQLPLGAASAWLVWAFRDDQAQLAFPAGGESFAPGASIPVYWDALEQNEPWAIDVSLDSAQTWATLAEDLAPALRYTEVTLPDTLAEHAFLRLRRASGEAIHQRPFQLFPQVSNIKVVKACPDSIWIQWDTLAVADHYTLHTLGEKYMTPLLQTTETAHVLPTWNPLADNWFALSAQKEERLFSERSNAVNHRLGLLACTQTRDMRPSAIISPQVPVIQSCEPAALEFTLSVRNDGLVAVTNVPVVYQVADEPPVTTLFSGTIQPGALRFGKLNPAPVFSTSGAIPLKIWTDLPDDQFRFNDTLYVTVDALIQSTGALLPDVTENFEAQSGLPPFWSVQPSGQPEFAWQVVRVPFGDTDSTRALLSPIFWHFDTGIEDLVRTPQLDLRVAGLPRLYFDLAYSGFAFTAPDSLIVEVMTECDDQQTTRVHILGGPGMITVDDPSIGWEAYIPEAGHWRTEEVDLSPWAGQRIQIQFRSIGGYGNNLYLDNIRLEDAAPAALAAGFELEPEALCADADILFRDASVGQPDSYLWDFGEQADPAMATGAGPHTVRYSSAGWQTARLIVSRGGLSDTLSRQLEVRTVPVADLDFLVEGDSLFLLNRSTGGKAFRWLTDLYPEDNRENPSWYREPGLPPTPLEVTLIVSNECGEDTISRSLTISDLESATPEIAPWVIQPNPANGRLHLYGPGAEGTLWLEIIDMQGRLCGQDRRIIGAGPQALTLDIPHLSAGTYVLRLSRPDGYQALLFQVE